MQLMLRVVALWKEQGLDNEPDGVTAYSAVVSARVEPQDSAVKLPPVTQQLLPLIAGVPRSGGVAVDVKASTYDVIASADVKLARIVCPEKARLTDNDGEEGREASVHVSAVHPYNAFAPKRIDKMEAAFPWEKRRARAAKEVAAREADVPGDGPPGSFEDDDDEDVAQVGDEMEEDDDVTLDLTTWCGWYYCGIFHCQCPVGLRKDDSRNLRPTLVDICRMTGDPLWLEGPRVRAAGHAIMCHAGDAVVFSPASSKVAHPWEGHYCRVSPVVTDGPSVPHASYRLELGDRPDAVRSVLSWHLATTTVHEEGVEQFEPAGSMLGRACRALSGCGNRLLEN